jgi:hypothetical protein
MERDERQALERTSMDPASRTAPVLEEIFTSGVSLG